MNNVSVWPRTFCTPWSEPTLSVGDARSTSATTFLSALIRWQWVGHDVDQLGNQKDCIESLVIGSTWLQVEESAPLKQFLISWVKLSLIFYEGTPIGTHAYMNLAQSKINQWERLISANFSVTISNTGKPSRTCIPPSMEGRRPGYVGQQVLCLSGSSLFPFCLGPLCTMVSLTMVLNRLENVILASGELIDIYFFKARLMHRTTASGERPYWSQR